MRTCLNNGRSCFLLTIIIIFQLGLVTDGVSQQVKIDLHHFDIYIDQVNISA